MGDSVSIGRLRMVPVATLPFEEGRRLAVGSTDSPG